ncbi:cation:proton antiporter [Herpetosiphon giganteus]|uniref:cation:proton antiporter n=1 Tax=Herpetosiphon giganteus TaxID=2029754 RepID=UPI0019569A23|nr:cation:proton antiporter [Herpetosiphon giganteus]MBM7845193.1 Kef-type K+ transport system membrane component KefB [Herpetosiphon giganteus]
MSHSELAIHFFLQLAIILGVCRIVGLIAKYFGQPQVVGEMIAGVLMGPSLFGLILPDLQKFIFPSGPAMSILYACSQVGLVLYMFLIGVEFDLGLIRQRMGSALSVSLAGIITPLILGSLLSLLLLQQPEFFNPTIKPWQAMLFVGAAISITAFPMLARIIFERGLTGTSLGTLVLAAGSTDDAISWCLFAIVLAVFKNDPSIALLAVGGGLIYVAAIFFMVKPALRRLGTHVEKSNELSSGVFSFILLLVMICAWITDIIGIYAIFGGFILGTAMPRGVFADRLRHMLEPVVTNFMLPLFFIFSGLNTSITMVDSWWLWGLTLLVLATAIAGKGIACWAVARLVGEPQREALAIGTLMNARGLMELILLNIGLEHGIIKPTFFTVMVLMAILTTLMATPIFQFVYGRHQAKKPTSESMNALGRIAPSTGTKV